MPCSIMRGFLIVSALLSLLYAPPANSSPTTEEFMNRLVVCAGGIELSISAKLLGSVRSLYEGDRTEGKATMKTEATFYEKIPQNDRLAALELYHKCIRDIMSTSYAITEETLDFRFWVDIPFDLFYELSRNSTSPESLLRKGEFFEHVFSDVDIVYKVMRTGCNWKGLDDFNNDWNYYFAHGHRGHLFPDDISVSKKMWAQHFTAGKFAFGGRDWSGDKLNSKMRQGSGEELRSVEGLVGKCMYVSISGPFGYNFQYIKNPVVRRQAETYAKAAFKSIELSHFRIKLSNTFEIIKTSANSKKVLASESRALWQIALPKEIDGFRIR